MQEIGPRCETDVAGDPSFYDKVDNELEWITVGLSSRPRKA